MIKNGIPEESAFARRNQLCKFVEEAWASLYTTKSRPFDPPTTGKIAIKIINHYGDGVLKVYEI